MASELPGPGHPDGESRASDSQQNNNTVPGGNERRLVSGLGRSAMWRYAALGASTVEGVVVAGVALRRIGETGYGTYALAAAVIGLVGTIDFGLSLSVMRAVARDNPEFTTDDRARARADVSVAHATYVTAGAATLLVTGLVVLLLPLLTKAEGVGVGEDRITILLVGISVALFLGTAVFDGIPAGRSRFAVAAAAMSCGAVANVVFVIATIDRLHLVSLGAGQLIAAVVTRLIGAIWMRRHEPWFRFVPARAATCRLAQSRRVHFAAPRTQRRGSVDRHDRPCRDRCFRHGHRRRARSASGRSLRPARLARLHGIRRPFPRFQQQSRRRYRSQRWPSSRRFSGSAQAWRSAHSR